MQQGGGFGRKGAGTGAVPATRIEGIGRNRADGIDVQRRVADAVARDEADRAERDQKRAALIAEMRNDGLALTSSAPRYHEPSRPGFDAARAEYERDSYYGYREGSTPFGPAKLDRSVGIAYLLWFFFGGFSAHRFYLGAIQSGVVQTGFFVVGLALILTVSWFSMLGVFFCLIWTGWILLDLFLIPGLHRNFCRQ